MCLERTLDAPEIVDDYYLNLIDWGALGIQGRHIAVSGSSDGYTVASAAGNETLRFWQVFGAQWLQTLQRILDPVQILQGKLLKTILVTFVEENGRLNISFRVSVYWQLISSTAFCDW
ncbi:hypothetical protein SUGI_0736520 [Cryptomeria japonica]|nr:hypothetical protein SUGI_0736520 [Cryptomeria japonica]